jgi:hypothetical protein
VAPLVPTFRKNLAASTLRGGCGAASSWCAIRWASCCKDMLPSALSRWHAARRIRRNTDLGPLHAVKQKRRSGNHDDNDRRRIDQQQPTRLASAKPRRLLPAGSDFLELAEGPKARPGSKYIHALDDFLILRNLCRIGRLPDRPEPHLPSRRLPAQALRQRPRFPNCRWHSYRRKAHGRLPRAHNWRRPSPMSVAANGNNGYSRTRENEARCLPQPQYTLHEFEKRRFCQIWLITRLCTRS